MDATAIKGVLWLAGFVVVFIGSPFLLLSMILGPKLAYWVTGAVFFGILGLLSLIWFGTALGPKGPETTWHPAGIGTDLTSVEGFGESYDVSDYPSGEWKKPASGDVLPGLKGGEDTKGEVANIEPVLESFISTAVSDIRGKRDSVKDQVHGSLELKPGDFEIVDIRMKEARVDAKPSIIAVARVVPSEKLNADLGGPKEGEVAGWLVDVGDEVDQGQPILTATTDKGEIQVKAIASGKLIEQGLKKGDKVVSGGPVATLDVSGKPGSPTPAEVVAGRVIGSARRPALYYLIASLVLFLIHLAGLGRAERSRLTAQPATS
ncbi:MAG: biotin/lipoyl-containing protein [Actinomycetota bacterium]